MADQALRSEILAKHEPAEQRHNTSPTEHPDDPATTVASAPTVTNAVAAPTDNVQSLPNADRLQAWHQAAEKEIEENWPYRQSQSSWAGGDHYFRLYVGDAPGASGWSKRAWSRNGKWSGSDSHARITVTARCLREMQGRILIGDLVTADCEKVAPREYRATWVEQSKGFALKLVEGWVIRGQHIRAATLSAARKKARLERNAQASRLWSDRRRVATLDQDLSRILVTRADSLAAGNCEAGTDAFIRSKLEFLGDAPAVRAAHLLIVQDSVYTRRAIAAAWRRIASKGAISCDGSVVHATKHDDKEVLV